MIIHWFLCTHGTDEFLTTLLPLLRSRAVHTRIADFHELWINQYLKNDFYLHFRMLPETKDKLLNVLIPYFKKNTFRGGNYPVDISKQLLIFLWYVSKGDSIISTSDRFNVAVSTVHNAITIFLDGLMNITNKYIFWPNKDECQILSEEFFQISGYPDVIGCIDGTHILCKVPENQHDSYIDRRLNKSMQMQGIATSKKVFTNIFVGFPGAVHDARVFSESPIYRAIMTTGEKYIFNKYHLVGDSAYPCMKWLMTPYQNNNRLTRIQKNHNICLSKARVYIENTFGLLKGRWRILQYVNVNSIERVGKIIAACCTLHNFCLMNGDDFTSFSTSNVDMGDVDIEPAAEDDNDRRGFQKTGHHSFNALNLFLN